ncbi:unnamed protein product [Rotaria magnacalcarata]
MRCLNAIFTKIYSNPREPDNLIDFIERWIPYYPQWIIDNILDQLIFPMLHREVDSWLHPWLPLMKYRLEPLYPPIRTKLATIKFIS